jgi:hypothetical protein
MKFIISENQRELEKRLGVEENYKKRYRRY